MVAYLPIFSLILLLNNTDLCNTSNLCGMRRSPMEKIICVPFGSEFDIKCPTGQPRILISSHYDCPTFMRLSVIEFPAFSFVANSRSSPPLLARTLWPRTGSPGSWGASGPSAHHPPALLAPPAAKSCSHHDIHLMTCILFPFAVQANGSLYTWMPFSMTLMCLNSFFSA